MSPFFVVRHKTPGFILPSYEQENWSSNRKQYIGDPKKPTAAVALPRSPGEPVLILLGGGEVYREELAEMAERVRETPRTNIPRPGLVQDLKQAIADRMGYHRRNFRTDPAPNYTQPERKFF